MLLHGWTAAANWWDRVTPALAKDHRVVRIDLLGHGDSAKPDDGYSMNEQADRMAAALQKARRAQGDDRRALDRRRGGDRAALSATPS